jgi:hypothetical protein
VRITRVLTIPEYDAMQKFCREADGYYMTDRRVFTPGMAWYCPWIFDPLDELKLLTAPDRRRVPMITAERRGELGYLSEHYWRDWASSRAPICVTCPNGEQWEIDRKSGNGTGWTVTGALPLITCSPSIVVEGYHGFLREGEFTPDLEGRGANGVRL